MGLPAGAGRARGPRRRAGSGPLRLKAKKDEKQPQNGGFRVLEPVLAEKCRFWAIYGRFFGFFARFHAGRDGRPAAAENARIRGRLLAAPSRLLVNLSC